MKTLVLIPDLKHKGGVTNYYRCLALNKNPTIDYFYVNTLATDPGSNAGTANGFNAVKKAIYVIPKYLKFLTIAHKYQLMHINPSMDFNSFFRDLGFIYLSKIMRKKVIVFYRGWEDEFEKKVKNNIFLNFLFNSSYAKSNCFIVLGNTFKEKLINLGVNPEKTFYIETTIADSDFINDLELDKKSKSFDNQINLLFIARILKEKGIYIAIDAAAKCNAATTDRKVKLYIAGDGEELENAKRYVKLKGFTNIEFVGYAMNDIKKDVLLKCHIMLFPTYYREGLPNSILEGMLYGMPIVSRVIAGIPDVVEQGKNGYLTESLDSDIFADYCCQIINDKALYDTMAKNNSDKAKKLFITEVVKNRLINIYIDQT